MANTKSLFSLAHHLVGINVVDTYKIAEHHNIINYRLAKEGDHKMPMERFAGYLAYQLICKSGCIINALDSERGSRVADPISADLSLPKDILFVTSNTSSKCSSVSGNDTIQVALRLLKDKAGGTHHQVSYDKCEGKNGKKYTKTRACALCLKEREERVLVKYKCLECNLPFCCIDRWNKTGTDCFALHVRSITKRSKRLRDSRDNDPDAVTKTCRRISNDEE